MKIETKGKIKIYFKKKINKTRKNDRGAASYICYYKGESIDVFGVYSPKAAIRKVNKYIKKK